MIEVRALDLVIVMEVA